MLASSVPRRRRVTHGTLAYRGNYQVPWCTEQHLAASFEAIGWEVIRLQEHDAHDLNGEPVPAAKPSEILAAAEEADVFLSTRTWSWPALTAEQWSAIASVCERHGTITAAFHLDLLWGIGREHLVRTDPMFRADFVFTADGGHQAEFAEAGVNHIWLQPGVFHEDCHPGEFNPRWDCDVAFVGSVEGYHPEHSHRRSLDAFLRQRYGRRYLRVGNGRPTVRGDDLNDLYRSAKVVVGDSLALDQADALYWSDRIPETVGRGGLLFHPRIDSALGAYVDTVRWWEWGDFAGLARGIEAQFESLAERGEDEVESARQRRIDWALGHHTYAARAVGMLRAMDLPYDEDALARIEKGER